MKPRTIVWTMLAGTLAANPAAMAWEQEGIPLPAGHFSYTEQGSAAECLNPTSGAPESCSASGVRVVPVSVLENGAETRDGTGNVCETEVAVVSTLPVNASPPTVQTVPEPIFPKPAWRENFAAIVLLTPLEVLNASLAGSFSAC